MCSFQESKRIKYFNMCEVKVMDRVTHFIRLIMLIVLHTICLGSETILTYFAGHQKYLFDMTNSLLFWIRKGLNFCLMWHFVESFYGPSNLYYQVQHGRICEPEKD